MSSLPQVGQWWEANATSAVPVHRPIDSVRYPAQACASRTWAPRSVRMLCIVWVAFSAMHTARRSGRRTFISSWHSVPGVIWKRNLTPSRVASCPVVSMYRVGGIRPMVPVDTASPSPQPTWPAASVGRLVPYM